MHYTYPFTWLLFFKCKLFSKIWNMLLLCQFYPANLPWTHIFCKTHIKPRNIASVDLVKKTKHFTFQFSARWERNKRNRGQVLRHRIYKNILITMLLIRLWSEEKRIQYFQRSRHSPECHGESVMDKSQRMANESTQYTPLFFFSMFFFSTLSPCHIKESEHLNFIYWMNQQARALRFLATKCQINNQEESLLGVRASTLNSEL